MGASKCNAKRTQPSTTNTSTASVADVGCVIVPLVSANVSRPSLVKGVAEPLANDCSGHGQCRTDANSFYYIGQTPKVPYGTLIPTYSKARGASTWGIYWPWLKYQQCHCDAGYE